MERNSVIGTKAVAIIGVLNANWIGFKRFHVHTSQRNHKLARNTLDGWKPDLLLSSTKI